MSKYRDNIFHYLKKIGFFITRLSAVTSAHTSYHWVFSVSHASACRAGTSKLSPLALGIGTHTAAALTTRRSLPAMAMMSEAARPRRRLSSQPPTTPRADQRTHRMCSSSTETGDLGHRCRQNRITRILRITTVSLRPCSVTQGFVPGRE